MEPRDYAERAESLKPGFTTDREHFSGWGIMGLPFRSGDILAMRRFPASSVGPGYSSVWHRQPAGSWAFYSDAPPMQSCNRYFGSAVDHFIRSPIELRWQDGRTLVVTVPDADLVWTSHFQSTPATRVMNGMGRLMPEPLWRNSLVLDIMSRFAGFALGTGRLRMRGRAPNGQSFIANPRLIWTIPRATATLAGVDLGPLGPVPQQATLGDFAIPQRGILAVGLAFFEPFDENRHLAVASRETA